MQLFPQAMVEKNYTGAYFGGSELGHLVGASHDKAQMQDHPCAVSGENLKIFNKTEHYRSSMLEIGTLDNCS